MAVVCHIRYLCLLESVKITLKYFAISVKILLFEEEGNLKETYNLKLLLEKEKYAEHK